MTGFKEIKDAIDTSMEAFEAFKSSNGERVDDLQDRLEAMEARASNPGKSGIPGIERKSEHVRIFEDWLKKPKDHDAAQKLANIQASLVEKKTLSVGSTADGGFAVPEEISRDIERLELQFSPARSLVRVERTSAGDYKKLVNVRGAAAGWVDETTQRTESNTSQLREVIPTFGELYAYPQTTEWAFDDIFFNVGDWLAEEVAQQFSILEGTAIISGDGSNKPTGMLAADPVLDDDFASPLRAANKYEYIPCDTDAAGSPAAPGVLGDCLIDLVYQVRSQYRAMASWVMNSATTRAVRKLKDQEGNYLWAPGLVAGQPDRLLGYPVATWEQMPDIAANAFPIAFGDFRRGYLLVDRTNLRITVDSNITTPGRIKFYVRRRVGGFPLNTDAIKFIRTVQ